MDDEDREEVKEIVATCGAKCIQWWQFLSVLGSAIILGGFRSDDKWRYFL